jgi:hypothetical protein
MVLFFNMKKTMIITLLMIFIAVPSFADIYKYTDENGVVCYTDTPYGKKGNLPKRN